MADRLQLQKDLIELLGSDNVYFDPPELVKIQYPCFIYQSDIPFNVKANNHSYLLKNRYSVLYVDEDPDSGIQMIKRLLETFSESSAGNPYISENLHHYPFDVYY